MKKIFVGIVTLLSVVTYANVTRNAQYELNTKMGGVAYKHQLGTLVDRNKNLIKAVYDYSYHGGAVGEIALTDQDRNAATIPDNAIITRMWLDVVTVPSSSDAGSSIGFKVQSDQDVYDQLDEASWTSGVKDGVTTDDTTPVKLTAARTVTATIASEALTAGFINVFIEYMQSN